MRGELAIFNLEIKKKSGLSINPDIHHFKLFSSEYICKCLRINTLNQPVFSVKKTESLYNNLSSSYMFWKLQRT